ncbi:Gfo/Idh/MocA family protein [Oceaniglobus roseus]|uniref:Gfo/Idh/MocA family protein n=1 Tax=Oceaniglobus roseus TaxID=1737570 RepID=UPI000C7ECA0B|nr:Gfo/Idh/MocA family oxidoreductase [Kandeliimicrobium roseum]
MTRKIAIVGVGKIARDQHVPSIAASDDWTLAATVSRSGTVDNIEAFTDIHQMLAARPDIPVVSLCMPPAPRFASAEACLLAGRHVMLEKPPGMTISEVQILAALAADRGLTLFATWHSRMAPGVDAAKAWLADKAILSVRITWHEDVRRWHPNQDWVFEPGGMGVFDPGINALSILTEILPFAVRAMSARLEVPSNRQAPIAARVVFSHDVVLDLDWQQTGAQVWNIEIETDAGKALLSRGGACFEVDGVEVANGEEREYPRLYDRMSRLLSADKSEVDLRPMIHVADAMTLGERVGVEAFHF